MSAAAEIVFDRVTKQYPGREQHALHELSLEIPAGSFCVLGLMAYSLAHRRLQIGART